MTLTSTFRVAEGKDECILSWKLPPCTSFKEIMSVSAQTRVFRPPALCILFPVLVMWSLMLQLQHVVRPTGTDSPPPHWSRWRQSRLRSGSLVPFWWRAVRRRGGLKLQCPKELLKQKRSRSFDPTLNVMYHWWRSSLIHSVAPCKPPRAGPPPWAGPPPLQRPVMAWQTPHGSSATQPVFF